MAARTVNFTDDLAAIRQQIDKQVNEQAKNPRPISAIEVGFKLCQAGVFVLNFDTRDAHERDGEWTEALNGDVLELPHWQDAYEAVGDEGIAYTLLSGESKFLPPGTEDQPVAAIFGETLLAVIQDAKARGVFDVLPLRDDCQVEVLEFDWMYEWPPEDQIGITNLFSKL